MLDEPILRIEGLSAQFDTIEGAVRAVRDVSLSLGRGATLALTGESGAGKTSVGLAVLKLLPHPGRITGGQVYFDGTDILTLSPEEMRQLRGSEIAMVFQDPATGLNPVLTVGAQVEEVITAHLPVSKREARNRSLDILAQMGLPQPEEVARNFPFHLSGGMAQRVMIAIATALNPKVLIADEPTSALDVTVQAAILDDLRQLQRRFGTSILLITHDLGVVAQMADEVAVMYAGSIIQAGPARTVFQRPRHPYTWALLRSRPRWDRDQTKPLPAIRGTPPDPADLSEECPYLPRCPKATSVCRTQPAPALAELDRRHFAACYNPVYAGDDDADPG
ncbi:MAG: methionine ABC transporter ATP-binding protein [Actinobacteria bacterium RBG_13_63_9]|nr:MAG: methionine ABC transporter ATP-binding protein [Actinobacteria bacterium RBG_13_63_9]